MKKAVTDTVPAPNDSETPALAPSTGPLGRGGAGNGPKTDPGPKPPGELEGSGSGDGLEPLDPGNLDVLLDELDALERDPSDPPVPPDKTGTLDASDSPAEVS